MNLLQVIVTVKETLTLAGGISTKEALPGGGVEMINARTVLALGRLLQFFDPTEAEIGFLSSIAGEERQISPGQRILSSGAVNEVFLLLDGWAANASVSAEGAVRINTINLPGDILGMPSLVLAQPLDHTYSLTKVIVKQISMTVMRTIFQDFPRIAAVIMLIAQEERATKNEWNMLHTASAEKRFAGFLFRIGERLEHLNKIGGFDMNIPLTQRQLAEAVGVTPVYIHQLIHRFQDACLITYQRGHLRLAQPEKLRDLAGLANWTILRPEWLPDSERSDKASRIASRKASGAR